jgi:hypothetical protein
MIGRPRKARQGKARQGRQAGGGGGSGAGMWAERWGFVPPTKNGENCAAARLPRLTGSACRQQRVRRRRRCPNSVNQICLLQLYPPPPPPRARILIPLNWQRGAAEKADCRGGLCGWKDRERARKRERERERERKRG